MKRTAKATAFNLKVEFGRETDGRVIAARLEHGEAVPGEMTVSFAA